MYAHHAHSNVRCFDLDLTAIGAQPPSATSLLVRPPSPPRSTSPLPATCLEGWVARNTGVAAERAREGLTGLAGVPTRPAVVGVPPATERWLHLNHLNHIAAWARAQVTHPQRLDNALAELGLDAELASVEQARAAGLSRESFPLLSEFLVRLMHSVSDE